ncbi:type VI secretion system tube protein TssD [Zobellia sp. 1_MG-2023]|uniref:type VI secretion system tube protein TssD n=1 Tax=Zobellia sp. 1_MG-2023 TaxID=3062626 RepID=UPI00259749B6|nr:type VI secretion system tube protein TssD [Zobellia sp. 1_MG-2023]MDO6819000.1 type VI secretion system tube protein TssD [Zobellia sp. 1_MG-2023]
MSFKAKLNLGGKEYNILNCNYDLFQETDPTGRPSSVTRGGKITVTVESNDDTAGVELMMDNFGKKDGSITYTKRDTDATLKEIKFTEAYMVKYRENFDATGTNPLTETFTLSAKELNIGGGQHQNEWVM